jgi:uncharacterized membrane protein YbhN (UPF0104 family)
VSKTLRLIISALLLAWLASRLSWAQLGREFAHLRLEWWLAAAGLYVLTQVVSAFRWQLLAGPLGFQQTLRQFTGYYFIGMFFNLFLPTSVGGDVIRALYLDGGGGRKLPAFLSTFLDRFSGLLVLLALACSALALNPIPLPVWISLCVWGAAGCAALGMAALLATIRWTGRFTRVRRLREAVLIYLDHPHLLVYGSALSVVVQAANVIVVWLAGQALGLSVPAAYYWILVPMVTLLTLLPISLNGMGIREGGTILFLAPLGIDETAALSLAFLWFAVFTAVSLLGGSVYLFGRFPRPQVQDSHGSVDRDSDQGRARQPKAAA